MAARVKQSLFGVLGPRVEGASVLDLYAGTGSLSLEALSRGAAHAVLVERDPSVAALARRNAEQCGFGERVHVLVGDARDAVRLLSRLPVRPVFDLVFCDPPYALWDRPGERVRVVGALQGLALAGRLQAGSVVAVGLPASAGPEALAVAPLEVLDRRTYGQSAVCLVGVRGGAKG